MTPELLQAATGCTRERAALFAPLLAEACEAYPISTPRRLAAFLAQIGHECGSFRTMREVWGPTEAQARYEGRADLGNTLPGDGRKYAGHGCIQITGRYNHRHVYERLSRRFGPGVPDFEAQPERLSDPRWAVMSAADYWCEHGCNELADADDFEAITRRINGGLNGQSDRMVRWKLAKLAIGEGSAPLKTPPTLEPPMPLPAIAAALLPSVIEAIPMLAKLFGSGSDVAERNVKAATLALDLVQKATGAVNAQDAVDKITRDPAAAQAATAAIEASWLQLTEAGGDGIAGARRADAAAQASGESVWRSPSFVIGVMLLPLVYLIVGSVVGLFGPAWPPEVRAAIAGTVTGTILGGLIGYYYGQTTSRNRSPATP